MYDFVYKHKRWLQIALLVLIVPPFRCSVSIFIFAILMPEDRSPRSETSAFPRLSIRRRFAKPRTKCAR